jgi:hypothetical protein
MARQKRVSKMEIPTAYVGDGKAGGEREGQRFSRETLGQELHG